MSVIVRERWTEEEVCALPSGEHDYFERKSGAILASSDFDLKLAKAISAFTNSGGGYLILGVRDDGTCDGVDPLHTGRTSTRDWLEQIIPNLVDFPLDGFRVHEVERAAASSIPTQKLVIAVDVPDSEQAPHQSQKDKKYYVRLGGRSEPASHRMIEDIRNRTRHPNIELRKIGIQHIGRGSGQPPANAQFDVTLKLTLANSGRLKANNCCVLLIQDGSARFGPDETQTSLGPAVPRPVDEWRGAFWELQHPIYPGMETDFTCRFSFPAHDVGHGDCFIPGTDRSIGSTEIAWKIYADSAPAKSGTATLRDMEISPRAAAMRRW